MYEAIAAVMGVVVGVNALSAAIFIALLFIADTTSIGADFADATGPVAASAMIVIGT